MIKYELLTVDDYNEICCKLSYSEKINQLVAILCSKGIHAYSNFIKCLESEKEHLGHSKLVLKLKKTCAKLQLQQVREVQCLCGHIYHKRGKIHWANLSWFCCSNIP